MSRIKKHLHLSLVLFASMLIFGFQNQSRETVKIEITLRAPELPKGYSQVFICGNFNSWVPYDSAFRMKASGNNTYFLSLEIPKGSTLEYKFTLGNWEAAETDAAGRATSNRTAKTNKDLRKTDRVVAWKSEFTEVEFGNTKISSPGKYGGYSLPEYDSWTLSSQYVTMRDGEKIAIDIIRPAKNGIPANTPLPVLWTMQRYQRGRLSKNTRTSILGSSGVQKMLKYGYVVVVADARGTGASTGVRKAEFHIDEAIDGYEINRWLARQSWSNGNTGMFGRSYLGITQFTVAATAPPALKAIFPEMPLFDLYDFVYSAGVLRRPFVEAWSNNVKRLDMQVRAAPVDDDTDQSILNKAIQQRQKNKYPLQMVDELKAFRDAWHEESQCYPFIENSPASQLDNIRQSQIPAYILSGWKDAWPKDAIIWYLNLAPAAKLIMGPWHHGGYEGFDLGLERVRWFDYWLKGIDNGIAQQPGIYYHTSQTSPEKSWAFTNTWPLQEAKVKTWFLGAGVQGRPLAQMDENILPHYRTADNKDTYTFDLTATSGNQSRWTSTHGGPYNYPDMSTLDKKSLSYTTQPLSKDLKISGHPMLYLWVIPQKEDFELFAFLNEVDPAGKSTYVTEGCIKASYRIKGKPEFHTPPTPWFRSFEEDLRPVRPSEPVLIVFDLMPLSHVFKKGNSIRLSICASDSDNAAISANKTGGAFTLLSSDTQSSFIELPVVE